MSMVLKPWLKLVIKYEFLCFRHFLIGASAIIDAMAMDSAEGIITVAGENYVFDYDRINPVIFQVQAVDKADHVTTVPVTINLIDVNNKAPTYVVVSVLLNCLLR